MQYVLDHSYFSFPNIHLDHRDNLEFLQWMKRYWLQNYGGHEYDAVARRRGAPTDTPATIAPLRAGAGLTASTSGGSKGRRTPLGRF